MPTTPKPANLNATSVDILNAIRNSATANYRNYVPVANQSLDSIREIGAVIMQFPALQNEFLSALVNRIGRVMITSKMFTNPWTAFKKGMLEFGETVEEIFVNIAKPFVYDPEVAESEVFKRNIPDVRAAFHILNYQKFYKATIQNEQLRQAFLSWDGITDLIAKIVDSMYTGANYDEFVTMKYLLAKHILNGELYPVGIAGTTAAVKSDVSTIKGVSNKMTFPSTKYNLAGVTTHTPKEEQYFITNATFDSVMDVEVLAAAFNMSKAEFMGHRVMIDGFGELDSDRLSELFADNEDFTAPTEEELTALNAIPAVIVSKDWFMIFDNLVNFTEQYNGEGLYWNYWYHVWKTFSVSPFANAAVFVPGTPSVSAVDVTPASATVSAGQSVQLDTTVTNAYFASKAVNWTLSAVIGFPSILVNGGGSAVTAGATSVPFDGAEVAVNALAGRKVKFGSATTVYTIVSNTVSALTITPALAANVADNATINAADSVSGADVPAEISPLGSLRVYDNCPAGTVITATATSVVNNAVSDYSTITVS